MFGFLKRNIKPLRIAPTAIKIKTKFDSDGDFRYASYLTDYEQRKVQRRQGWDLKGG